jgi:S-adenosylmethionine synthetase
MVLSVEQELTTAHPASDPEVGEDVKVMGIRSAKRISLTIACAFVDRFLVHLDDYLEAKERVKSRVEKVAREIWGRELDVIVNAADLAQIGEVYITVTGTSAECGDDGQVGRGNRINGLITPSRPMSLEAASGKNPITHTGKIYNIAAKDIAESIVRDVPGITAAECYLVSQIGAPIGEPAFAEIRASSHEETLNRDQASHARDIAMQHLGQLEESSRRLWLGMA